MSRARNWCFTVNYPTRKLEPASWFITPTYLVYQLELAPVSKTPHYQGYVQFPSLLRLSQVKQFVGNGAHLVVARGTPIENHAYCTKLDSRAPGDDSGPFVFGIIDDTSKQGKRNDWHDIKDMCAQAVPDVQIAQIYPRQFGYCFNAVKKRKSLYVAKRTTRPFVHVIVGPTDTGKTHYATTRYSDIYIKEPVSRWWDLYDCQPEILLDDFSGGLPFNTLIRLCDKYDFAVETKETVLPCPATVVVITSNHAPESWYNSDSVCFDSFKRRVSKWSLYRTRDDHLDFDSYEQFRDALQVTDYYVSGSNLGEVYSVSS